MSYITNRVKGTPKKVLGGTLISLDNLSRPRDKGIVVYRSPTPVVWRGKRVENPFPLLPQGAVLSREGFISDISSKYTARRVLRGGPIPQPAFFAAIERSQKAIQGSFSHSRGRRFLDGSYNPCLAHPDEILSFESLIDFLLSSPSCSPLVFKPNKNALGKGILFIKTGEREITITMADLRFTLETDGVKDFLGRSKGVQITEHPENNILEIKIKKNLQGSNLLLAIWEIVASATSGSYDSGMVEAAMPVFRVGGKGFTTRHAVEGNLFTGDFIFKKTQDPVICWKALVGSSAFFSNLSGRVEQGAFRISWPDMFIPLLEGFSLPSSHNFMLYLDNLIREQLDYFSKRLLAAGIVVDKKLVIVIDLLWHASRTTKEGYPIPLFLEMDIISAK